MISTYAGNKSLNILIVKIDMLKVYIHLTKLKLANELNDSVVENVIS